MEFTLDSEEFAAEVSAGIIPEDLHHAIDLLDLHGTPEAWGVAVDDIVMLEEV